MHIIHFDKIESYALGLIRFVHYHCYCVIIHYYIHTLHACASVVQIAMLNHSNDIAGDTHSFRIHWPNQTM